MQKERTNWLGALFYIVVLALVPLIVSGKKYSTNLVSFPWFSDSSTYYDFFLYWKGQALILMCGVIAMYMAVKILVQGGTAFGTPAVKYLIPLAVYLGMSVISTVCSDQRQMAVMGDYEQWEGMIILSVYVILLLMGYVILKDRRELTVVAWGILGGVMILAFLSAMQAFGYDFFRTRQGKSVMNAMLDQELRFTFNFEPGRVYSTLYNPNYVGSYVALFFPVVASFIAASKKVSDVVRSVLAVLTLVLLAIMLLGSQSVTGCIGIFATALLFVCFMVGNRSRRTWKLAFGGVLCVMVMGLLVWNNRAVFEYGWNKIMHPTPNRAVVTTMVSRGGALEIGTKNEDMLKLMVEEEKGTLTYETADEKGNPVPFVYDEEYSKLQFQDERFEPIEILEEETLVEGKNRRVITVSTPSVGRSYTVAFQREKDENGLVQMNYRMLNPFDKLDALREIPCIGFRDRQHFGSRRGYIWSRTFPLLKEHFLLGSGPNTFVCEFPNDDYVGMKNVDYDGAIVTKPHNMYLQIFVQTGLVSLLAFLALYGIYVAECLRLYRKREKFSFPAKFGVGIWFGTFGYLVTGLANDSTVAVAPLYWCLLGVGFAVNRYERRKQIESEKNIAGGN